MPENQRLPARAAADCTFSALPKGAMEPAAEMPHAIKPGVANDPQPVEDRLDATALVHEAYARLVGDHQFADRGHFFRVAAEAMRRILIDHARRKQRIRHGGDCQRVPLSEVEVAPAAAAEELLALD